MDEIITIEEVQALRDIVMESKTRTTNVLASGKLLNRKLTAMRAIRKIERSLITDRR